MSNHFSKYIYRDDVKEKLVFDLGKIDKRYSGVITGERNLNIIQELRKHSKNKKNFQVLPSFNDANYLLQTPGCMPTVWDINVGGIKIDRYKKYIQSDLNNCDFAILLKNQLNPKYTFYTQYVLKTGAR